MSTEALTAKKKMVQNYFLHHPDSRSMLVIKDGRIINSLFDYGYASNNRDSGNVQQQKSIPHVTLFSDDCNNLSKGDIVEISLKRYTIYSVKIDETEETFQAELFLTPVKD